MVVLLKKQVNTKSKEIEKAREEIETLKEAVKEAQERNLRLISIISSHGLRLPLDESPDAAEQLSIEDDMPAIYVEEIKRERDHAISNNKHHKSQLAEIRMQNEQLRAEIVKLHSIIKRYRRIVKEFKAEEATNPSASVCHSNSIVSTEIAELEPNSLSPAPASSPAKAKTKLSALQVLAESIKDCSDVPRVISLCLK